eukprot:5138592-Prymnesium_polylepis.1
MTLNTLKTQRPPHRIQPPGHQTIDAPRPAGCGGCRQCCASARKSALNVPSSVCPLARAELLGVSTGGTSCSVHL